MIRQNLKTSQIDWFIIFSIVSLVAISTIVLRSVAPFLYPTYFFYIALAGISLYLFLKIDFDIFSLFSPHLYLLSILFLLTPLLIGQVTRGAVRWIPIGSLTLQPSEIVRPFLVLFFANFITKKELDFKRLLKAILLFSIPVFLILIQPSLGVAILTTIGCLGVFLASTLNKRHLFVGFLIIILSLPFLWFVLKPYQKDRIMTFLDPTRDPYGAGYNSIQAQISVGSGGITGRGLGEGVQTQLAFLPEKHTDFVFAAIAEELGFVGSGLVLLLLFVLFIRIIVIMDNAKSPEARAYITGIFLILLSETIIHTGMNIGLLPITGVPLPFVSAGGSALLGSCVSLALIIKAKKDGLT